MGNAIVAGIVALVILCAVLFARFLAWKDGREMDRAETEIHHVRQGILATPYNSAEW